MPGGYENIWPAALIEKLLKEQQFCKYCGAGIGKYKRKGEGTCPKCEDKSTVPSTT